MARQALAATRPKNSRKNSKNIKVRKVLGELIQKEDAEDIEQLIDGLTDRAKAFVLEYQRDYNGTKAAIRAGYSEKCAGTQAAVLLQNLHIKKAIKLATECRLSAISVTSDRIVSEYAKIAFLDVGQLYDGDNNLLSIHELPEEVRSAIVGIDTEHRLERGNDDRAVEITTRKVKLADKLSALRELSKLAVFAGVFKPSNEDNPSSGATNVQFNYTVNFSR